MQENWVSEGKVGQISPIKKMNDIELARNHKKRTIIHQKLLRELGTEIIDIDNLLQYLDNNMNETSILFERDVFEDIMSTIPKNDLNRINMTDFINSYLKSESTIELEISSIVREIFHHQEQLLVVQHKLEECRRGERKNEYGVMSGSVVIVALRTVNQGLLEKGEPMGGSVMQEGEEFCTQTLITTQNPEWNEDFSLGVQTGAEQFKIHLFTLNQEKEFVGTSVLSLEGLTEQDPIDLELDVLSDNQKIGGLYLSAQWIYSQVDFLTQIEDKWQNKIQMDNQQLQLLETHLTNLRAPFEKEIEQVLRIPIKTTSMITTQQHEDFFSTDEVLSCQFFSKFLWTVYLICTIFLMYIKPDFPNLISGIFGLSLSVLKPPIRPRKFYILGILIVFSLLLDIIWLNLIGGDWERGTKYESKYTSRADGREETPFLLLSYFITFVLALLKVVLFFLTIIMYQDNKVFMSHTDQHFMFQDSNINSQRELAFLG